MESSCVTYFLIWRTTSIQMGNWSFSTAIGLTCWVLKNQILWRNYVGRINWEYLQNQNSKQRQKKLLWKESHYKCSWLDHNSSRRKIKYKQMELQQSLINYFICSDRDSVLSGEIQSSSAILTSRNARFLEDMFWCHQPTFGNFVLGKNIFKKNQCTLKFNFDNTGLVRPLSCGRHGWVLLECQK